MSNLIVVYIVWFYRDLGNGEIALVNALQSYSTAPSNSISIDVPVSLDQTRTCIVKCELDFSCRNNGNTNSTTAP